ncbi:2-succinyl-5-enolpyruvyl-6-hydroxy-3-cyclohexene-1-carboxylic-acid synthase [Mobiluncus curtisii]|uniref:2-succinyl-5-enolpyruvyl-6-hydroxy-3- cyclohexene-1-carboxylic-acid synthase n=1 Tax=Mobiluncus curtisii TaxID=2051 RepID=UPI0014702E98|nr:2-succinyl-5-enolpyruvyl-6-hydroxy-3-cyclohexene-1-carboxylic-acid synthase [Mobiluncus curtisii]MCV0020154.1 2-succinyl-5-enolpyruvyl-6-hydroxy-3-cyclohexene-1-carboxylic-acid synthase [Mobiluncus curtisii]NMW47577.1 2-succinyl-5-enolpyruvyl-6-hydroxy-3-cyclohexene-1-carboxylic-acid synthase [Mobiluncus curtisii]NMW82589.1 2-succinyl-5-enolpyruvyl-6-hydroxy-3-cyclohexene-1-carboxylic-acid synthase [Mobiluncus curtisii]
MDDTRQRHGQDASSQQYAEELARLLVQQGFTHWFYCPGSRDAPLGYALNHLAASHRLDLHVRIDERDAAFMALGAARAGHPAVLVMTSGTAVGNALPAVMEAAHAGVPLLILSADRPAALRGTGANQTTWQPGIFGEFVRFAADIQPGVTSAVLSEVVSEVAAACRGEAHFPHPATNEKQFPATGPAHLNASFIEPLAPPEAIEAFAATSASFRANAREEPFDPDQAPRGTLLIAGDLSDATYADLREVVKNAGIPVLAEPQTAWRCHPHAVRGYAKAAGTTLSAVVEHNLERVIVAGRPTLTRPITRLISRRDIPVETVGAPGTTVNLAGNIARHWTDAATLACELEKVAKPSPASTPRHPTAETPESWLEMWRAAGENAVAALTRDWGFHRAAQTIWDSTMIASEPLDLYLGASLTIRVFDTVARNFARNLIPAPEQADVQSVNRQDGAFGGHRVFTNRGLAGIDGTIAAAWGAALARRQPMRLVLGDVSFFHDLGALCHGRVETVPNLQVIAINNGGGRIFGSLEHGAAPADTFTRMFLTPQVGDICELARAAGWQAVQIGSPAELVADLCQPVRGLSLMEVILPST